MSLLETFKSEVEAYLSASAMTPTAFGRQVLGDPNFVFDLRSGRSPNAATIDKVRTFIRSSQEHADARQ
jgi:homoserine dehydrogenase